MLADLRELNRHVVDRTQRRLQGLTDTEYLWEPATGCWSIRPQSNGIWAADWAPSGEHADPVTTIGWRLWHLTDCYGGARNAEWLNIPMPAGTDPSPSPTAEIAVTKLDRATHWWSELLEQLDEDKLFGPLGPVAAPFEGSTRLSFLLHMFDEQVHHGAEIGVLRDLYRAQG